MKRSRNEIRGTWRSEKVKYKREGLLKKSERRRGNEGGIGGEGRRKKKTREG